MNCQKCKQPAVIHLTEIVRDPDGQKRTMEIHLCVPHALESGIIATAMEVENPAALSETENEGGAEPTGIVPAGAKSGGLVIKRKEPAPATPEQTQCPVCGITWSHFKTTGHMGCAHDYLMFESRLLPIVKRAQEGATRHAGKVPRKMHQTAPAKQVAAVRIQRELQQALEAENYEAAARLRDQLRHLEAN